MSKQRGIGVFLVGKLGFSCEVAQMKCMLSQEYCHHPPFFCL